MTEPAQPYTIPSTSIFELEDNSEDVWEKGVDFDHFTESAKQSKRLRGLETRLAGLDIDMNDRKRLDLTKVASFFTDLYGPFRFLYSQADYEHIKDERSEKIINHIKSGNGSETVSKLDSKLFKLESRMVRGEPIEPKSVSSLRREFRGPSRRFSTQDHSNNLNDRFTLLLNYSENYISVESRFDRKLHEFESRIWDHAYIDPNDFDSVNIQLRGINRFDISQDGNRSLCNRAQFIAEYVKPFRPTEEETKAKEETKAGEETKSGETETQ